MSTIHRFAFPAILLPLAACGSGGAGGGALGSWKATDACALLDKAKVAQVMGQPVAETKLAPVVEDSGNGVSFSNCTYTMADGRMVSFMARNSTDAAHTPADIANTKKQLADMSPQQFEDVPGLGRTAYWSTGLKQLNVYLDEHRWLIFTFTFAGTGMMHNQGSSDELKAKAVALARAGGF